MPEQTVLRWSAYEHEHIERGSDWFWALGVIAVSAALTSVLFHNFLFALLIIVAATTLGLLANVPPKLAEFEVSEKGVRINDTLHRFDEILSFWVDDETGPHPMLLVDTTKPLAPNLIIPIHDIDPHTVRLFLRERAKETPMKEPLSHKVMAFFGF